MISVPRLPTRLCVKAPWRIFGRLSPGSPCQNGLLLISSGSRYSVTTCTIGTLRRRSASNNFAERSITGPQRSAGSGSVATAGSRWPRCMSLVSQAVAVGSMRIMVVLSNSARSAESPLRRVDAIIGGVARQQRGGVDGQISGTSFVYRGRREGFGEGQGVGPARRRREIG